MRSLVWFRGKDLRVADHGPLVEAAAKGEVIPLFVLDPFFFAPERARGLPHRMELLLEGLAALGAALERLGSALVLVEGRSVERVPELAKRWGVDRVLAHAWSEPFGRERDRRVAEALRPVGIPFELFEGETLAPPGSVRTAQGGLHGVFTPFARAFRQRVRVPEPLDAPDRLPPLPVPREGHCPSLAELGLVRNPNLQPGGERAAQLRLARFLDQGLPGYSERRHRMDLEGTSRLSADLHFGTLSVRTLWHAVAAHLGGPWEADARVFLDELLWREFAHAWLHERPDLLRRPFRPTWEGFPWAEDEAGWRAWMEGLTGFPGVDAAARQLRAEGFVHNRARMVAASFLAKDLMMDFRLGEAHYLAWLGDGDWANNDLGWQWSAGCGCDAQPWFRIFNPVAQGERFDPAGEYVQRWIPELRGMDPRWIHAPWKAPVPPRDYPPPILDHGAARARFLTAARRHLRTEEPGRRDAESPSGRPSPGSMDGEM